MSHYTDNIEEFLLAHKETEDCIEEITSQIIGLSEEKLPSLEYMNIIGSDGKDHFLNNSVALFRSMVRRFYLSSNSNILDLGSGCGRIAIPFRRYLDTGEYYGVDVWQDGVDWCNNSLGAHNFKFFCIPSNDNYYFSEIKNKRNNYKLNMISDSKIDFAFAISLFTHLKIDDSIDYLREISRCLKESGYALITCFIIDQYFYDFRKRTGEFKDVAEYEPNCFYAYSGQDFFAGYTYKCWIEMFDKANLRLVSFQLGSWAQKPGATEYQDFFIVGPKNK